MIKTWLWLLLLNAQDRAVIWPTFRRENVLFAEGTGPQSGPLLLCTAKCKVRCPSNITYASFPHPTHYSVKSPRYKQPRLGEGPSNYYILMFLSPKMVQFTARPRPDTLF